MFTRLTLSSSTPSPSLATWRNLCSKISTARDMLMLDSCNCAWASDGCLSANSATDKHNNKVELDTLQHNIVALLSDLSSFSARFDHMRVKSAVSADFVISHERTAPQGTLMVNHVSICFR